MIGKARTKTAQRGPTAIERAKTPGRYAGEIRVCKCGCGRKFHVWPREMARGGQLYATRECYAAAKRKGRWVRCAGKKCEEMFWVTPSREAQGPRRFHSSDCMWNTLSKPWKATSRRTRKQNRLCRCGCGELVGLGNNYFHSRACYCKFWRNRPTKHGTLTGYYAKRCRCAACSAASRKYEQALRVRLRFAEIPPEGWSRQPCLGCGRLFNVPPRESRRGNGRYCDQPCSSRAQLKTRWSLRREQPA